VLFPLDGLGEFGSIRDAAPDAWGRRVIEARLKAPAVSGRPTAVGIMRRVWGEVRQWKACFEEHGAEGKLLDQLSRAFRNIGGIASPELQLKYAKGHRSGNASSRRGWCEQAPTGFVCHRTDWIVLQQSPTPTPEWLSSISPNSDIRFGT
jgi:hypothetical protein